MEEDRRMRLDKKVAIVSGGAGGIGSGIVRRMAIEGAHVLVADIEMEGAQSVATEIGNQASAVYFDAYDQKSVEAIIQTAIDRYGRLDVLVNKDRKSTLLKSINTAHLVCSHLLE